MHLRLKLLTAVVMSALLSLGVSVPSQAATLQPTITVTNGTTSVHANNDGTLWASVNGAAPKQVFDGLAKNGISSLSYQNGLFIASSFFYIGYSSDGISWKRNYYPIGEKFEAGNIITDANFFERNVMTVESIQSFLVSKVNCTNGACLKDYTETTFDRAANLMCDAYTGKVGETAAEIIYNVSKACKVNPEVLIVLLQKEQGLVTASAPTSTKFLKATGYGCPDNADCNAAYFGFYNQVYLAAKQFQRYTNPTGTSLWFTWYPVGTPSPVLYNPNTTCGSGSVTMANKATAGLYYYTPYQPNAASLNAIWGEGDACSSYGNRNFWQYYNAWFNPEKDYKSWLLWNGSKYISVDDEGSVATSTNLISWTVQTSLNPTLTVKNFLKDSDGIYKIVYSDDTVSATSDGITWTASSLVPPPKPVVETKPQPVYYKVVKGNTLTSIAKKYKTPVKMLMKWNTSIKNANQIKVGQKIIVAWK